MRISKNRRDRKHLGFYRAVYGIRPPFTVVVDGTALQTSVNLQLDLKTELPKLLGGNVRLFVTPAVVAELRALGKEVKVATSMAKRLPKLRVGTSQAGAARDSIVQAAAKGDARIFVLTEDVELRETLSQRRGVPLLRFNRHSIVLDPPLERRGAGQASEPTPSEGPSRATHAEPQAATRTTPPGPSRKKKRKEPNPLSCKKKKPKPTLQEPARAKPDGVSDAQKSRRRKRSRGAGRRHAQDDDESRAPQRPRAD